MPSRKKGRFSGRLTANWRFEESCGVSRSTCEKSGLRAASNTVAGLTRHLASRLGFELGCAIVAAPSPLRAAERHGLRHDAQRLRRRQLPGRLQRRRQAHEAGRIRGNRRGRHGVPFLARIVAADEQVPVSGCARGVAQFVEGDAQLDHPAVRVDARGHLDFEIRGRGRSARVLVRQSVPDHAIRIEIEQLRHAAGAHRIERDGDPVLFVREVVAAREARCAAARCRDRTCAPAT